MRVPNLAGLAGYERGTPGILMIPGVVAQTMAGLGWTKRSMREFLWEHSRIPAEHLRRAGGHAWIEIDASAVTRQSLALDPWPITASPDNIVLIVAGGGHPTNSYWLQGYSPGASAARSTCRSLRAPARRSGVRSGWGLTTSTPARKRLVGPHAARQQGDCGELATAR